MTIIHIFCPKKNGGVREVAKNLGAELELLGFRVELESSLWVLFTKIIFCRDDLFILSTHAGVFSPLARKTILIVHGYPIYGVQNYLKKMTLIIFARLNHMKGGINIAVSHLTASVSRQIYGIPINDVIYNGVPRCIEKVSSATKKKNIVYMGRVDRTKGVESIIKAFVSAGLDYNLYIVGDGPLLETLRKNIRHPNIFFTGWLTEELKYEILSTAEIFVSLRDMEPMGITFMEADVLNCKIVGPYIGGYTEFVRDTRNIFRCDPFDVDQIVDSIKMATKSRYHNNNSTQPYNWKCASIKYKMHIDKINEAYNR